jgi:hypothetical protein
MQARLYPNPAAVGTPVQWQVFLPRAGDLELTLLNTQGQVLDQQRYRGDQYYARELRLPAPGLYQLQFRAGDQILTQKLVIQ